MLFHWVHSAGRLLLRGGAVSLREPKVFTEPGRPFAQLPDNIAAGRTLNEDRHAADAWARTGKSKHGSAWRHAERVRQGTLKARVLPTARERSVL